jgi:hypothetical protein
MLLPDQALFFLDVDKSLASAWAEGTNYFKVILPAKDTTKVNGLAAPGIRLGNAQEGIEFFAGDMQGNVWKVAFPNGLSTTKIADAVYKNGSNVKTPLFTARDTDGNIQSISSAPVIYPYRAGGNMVVFGTGRLLESVDRLAIFASRERLSPQLQQPRHFLHGVSVGLLGLHHDRLRERIELELRLQRWWRWCCNSPNLGEDTTRRREVSPRLDHHEIATGRSRWWESCRNTARDSDTVAVGVREVGVSDSK